MAAVCAMELGRARFDAGEIGKAKEVFLSCVQEWEVLGDEASLAYALIGLGATNVELGEYDEARPAYARALEIHARLGVGERLLQTRTSLALVLHALGHQAEAFQLIEESIRGLEERGEAASLSNALQHQGDILGQLGETERARRCYERSLQLAKQAGEEGLALVAELNLALMAAESGRPMKALRTLERVVERLEVIRFRPSVLISAYGNMAVLTMRVGRYAEALALYEQVLARFREAADLSGVARTLGNLADVYDQLGDRERSRAYMQEALALARTLGIRSFEARMLGRRGTLEADAGNFDEGLALLQQGQALAAAAGDLTEAHSLLGDIGSVHAKKGEPARAIECFQETLAYMERVGSTGPQVWLLMSIGRTHLEHGTPSEGRPFLERAVRLGRRTRDMPRLAAALGYLAKLELGEGRNERALGWAREGVAATEDMLQGHGEEHGRSVRQQFAPLFSAGALAAAREGDVAEAFRFLERGRAGSLLGLLESREDMRGNASALPQALRDAEEQARAKEASARAAYDRAVAGRDLSQTKAAAAALAKASAEVLDVTERVQRRLKKQDNLAYPVASTIEDVQGALPPGDAAVAYGICDSTTIAVVLRPDEHRIVDLGPTKAIVGACSALDASDPDTPVDDAVAALRRLLVEPLKLDASVTRVLISPEGPLCYVPFSLAVDRPVVMAPSFTTHVLLREESRETGQGVLALGDPDYGGVSDGAQAIYHRGRTLTALPPSRKEAETIGTTTLLGAKANETALAGELAARHRWRAVHFACRGLVDVERPMQSALALSHTAEQDGFLTAHEVLRAEMPADLVVLSACDTGRGQLVMGEGIVGFTRAFMFAGPPRVICSLWKVDDAATQALMIKFYELWNPKEGQGLAAAEALKKAQDHIRAQERWRHPYYRAAWVLWGLPD